MHHITEARCLDAFAGSGALGLEAWSRGAAEVTFIEQSPLAYRNLGQTLRQFNSPKLQLLQTDAYQYLQNQAPKYNLIFLDPPFAQTHLPACLQNMKVLEPGGLLYVESETPPQLDEALWQTIRSKKAGQVHYGLYKKTDGKP